MGASYIDVHCPTIHNAEVVPSIDENRLNHPSHATVSVADAVRFGVLLGTSGGVKDRHPGAKTACLAGPGLARGQES